MPRLLTCPDCGARYRVPDGLIGAEGRIVRCKACGESWEAAGAAVTPDALELADLEADETLARAVDLSEDMEFVDAPAPVGAKVMKRKSKKSAPQSDAAVQHRERKWRADWEARRSAKLRRIMCVWAVAMGITSIGIGTLIGMRQSVVEVRPEMAGLYEALGMDVNALGLDLSAPEVRLVSLDGQDYITVSGEVVNLTDEERAVPLVGMQLLGTDGESLASWSVDAGGVVPGGGRLDYETEYPNPPVDGVRLTYGFE